MGKRPIKHKLELVSVDFLLAVEVKVRVEQLYFTTTVYRDVTLLLNELLILDNYR